MGLTLTAGRDILVTGTGRSGTTLTCNLLNKLPDTVALFEPMKVNRFAKLEGHPQMREAVERFCSRQRASILERGTAISKHAGGAVPDNSFSAERADSGLRRQTIRRSEIEVGEVSSDFTLIVKHLAAFTAMLDELAAHFPVYAVVRNPLPVLASWSSIDVGLQDGHAPAAEQIAPELRANLAAIEDPLDRQLHLLAWFHGQFRRHLPDESIIRYEAIVESRGAALGAIVPAASRLDEPLESKNLNAIYDRDTLVRIGTRLLASEGAYWQTYSRESVEELLELSASGARPPG